MTPYQAAKEVFDKYISHHALYEHDAKTILVALEGAVRAAESRGACEMQSRCAQIATEQQEWNSREGDAGWNMAGAITAEIMALPLTQTPT